MADLSVIDIAPLFGDIDAEKQSVDDRIRQAIFDQGGFVISGYPDAGKVDDRAQKMLTFHDLPNAAKRAVASRVLGPANDRIYRGYTASLERGSWSHNEMFDIGPERPSAGPAITQMDILAEHNIWPAVEPAPGWQRTMGEFYDHMHIVATAVLLSVGRAAGFTDKDLTARFDGGNSTLRLLNYPPRPPEHRNPDDAPDNAYVDGRPLAAVGHTDASGLSLLWQNRPGLQAQSPGGVWRDVPQISNCVSVHLGTVLEIMTGGRVPATAHRVLDFGVPRQSIGFFLEPALGAQLSEVGQVPACSNDAADARGTYGWHLLKRLHGYTGYEHLVADPEQS